MKPTFLPDLFEIRAATFIFLLLVSTVGFSGVLYLWRWLSKLAGHPIGQNPSVKAIP